MDLLVLQERSSVKLVKLIFPNTWAVCSQFDTFDLVSCRQHALASAFTSQSIFGDLVVEELFGVVAPGLE